jgi:heptosyltransferase-3
VVSATKDLFRTVGSEARILLVRLRSMGDCLLLTAPVRLLKQQFPGFELSVLVEERFSECFSRNTDLAEVVTVSSSKLASVRGLLGRRYDAIINLHGGPTSLMYARAARGFRVGIEDFQYSFLYSGLIPRGHSQMHAVEKTLEWFGWMGLETSTLPQLEYPEHAEEATWVSETIGLRPYAVIHPAAMMDSKRWSVDNFARAGTIIQDQGWHVVVTAGRGEESLATRLTAELPDSLLLLGLSIPQLAELLRGADLYLGNDSGPMHLAAAVGTPTVAVWGSSNSAQWHPWLVPHRVVQNPFDCNPCAGHRCNVASTPLCIESVSVEQVAVAARDLLRETGRQAPIQTR